MKAIFSFPKIIFYSFLLLIIISCAKKDNEISRDFNYEVKPEIKIPENWALVEIDQPFSIIADFTPYGDDSVVEIIQTKFINPETGYELDLIHSDYVMHEGVYSYSGTATPFEKGEILLGVCSYKDEVVTQGHYSFFSYNGECSYQNLFAQDKIGTNFQVKTYLSKPSIFESILQEETTSIEYEFDIYKGDSGILTIDILDENYQVVENLLEAEIYEGGNGELSYQFLDKGHFYIRIKAQQVDGSDENYWLSKIIVN